MNPLAHKIAGLLPVLEAQEGCVYLFAFVERLDVNRWDLVFSSQWSDDDMAMAVFKVAKLLTTRLERQEMNTVARIVPIRSSEIPAELDGITPKDEKIIYESFLGLEVRRAFVFKAQHPSTPASSMALAGSNF